MSAKKKKTLNRVTEKELEQIKHSFLKTKNYSKTGKECGFSFQTVQRHIKKLADVDPEIAQLIEIEEKRGKDVDIEKLIKEDFKIDCKMKYERLEIGKTYTFVQKPKAEKRHNRTNLQNGRYKVLKEFERFYLLEHISNSYKYITTIHKISIESFTIKKLGG